MREHRKAPFRVLTVFLLVADTQVRMRAGWWGGVIFCSRPVHLGLYTHTQSLLRLALAFFFSFPFFFFQVSQDPVGALRLRAAIQATLETSTSEAVVSVTESGRRKGQGTEGDKVTEAPP